MFNLLFKFKNSKVKFSIDKNADYLFTDVDDERQVLISGASLAETGS